jgi:hypothetical protein
MSRYFMGKMIGTCKVCGEDIYKLQYARYGERGWWHDEEDLDDEHRASPVISAAEEFEKSIHERLHPTLARTRGYYITPQPQ